MLHPAAQSAAASPTAPSSSATSSSASNPGLDLTDTFLQLLTTQLQNQSPLDPLDPNAFVAQLAQFNSLGELTQIESLMQTLVNNTSAPASTSAGSSSNAVAGSTPSPTTNSVSH
jgi:flagellar basal-body rod modification protein FlgD